MTSSPLQVSFYGHDCVPQIEVKSQLRQFSFYGNDVITYVIPSKVLEFSRKISNQLKLSSF